jgi:hypothetical protein
LLYGPTVVGVIVVSFAIFAALTMSTGELMGLPILGLGVWYALARGRRLAR